MDRQTLLLTALAALCVAGLTVSVTGWVHLARERRATPAQDSEVGEGRDGKD